ncbi:site-specific integrase [Streptosporangium oxazolinicum]|uniref:Site-specific integrase n=1 Tax=Streptosporangium oxazolinicum TaxID=909287 RepID=A0ABP8APX9_9ACTN
MANLIKKCECADTKAARKLDLRKPEDRKAAERVWGRCEHSWTVRYRLGGRDTPQKEQSFPHDMRRDAEKLVLDIKGDKVSHLRRVADPKAGAILFTDYAETWLTGRVGLADSSARLYRSRLTHQLNPDLGHLKLNAITRQHIKKLISALRKAGYSPNTVHGAFMVVNAILNEAVKDKALGESPCVDIELPSIGQSRDFVVPSWDQIRRLAEAMPDDWALTIWLMAGCGLRIGEARAVDENCIMFGGRRLRITQQVTQRHSLAPLKHREEGDYRDMPLPPFVKVAITAHIAAHGVSGDGLLFRGRKSPYINSSTYQRAFKVAVEAAGLPEGFTPHGLRHAFVSLQLAQGVPITDLSRWLGHADIKITYRIYGHMVEEAWDRATEAMEASYRASISPHVESAAAC